MTYIHTETYGQGQPVLLIHGWAMHSGVWRDFAQLLAQHCQVICVDLPGHGRSEAVWPYDLNNLVRSLLPILPVQPSVLLGWSLGASVAMALAERVPERVKHLCLLAGNPCFVQKGDWPGMKSETLDAFADMLKNDVQQTLIRFLALQVNGLAHGKDLLQQLKRALSEAPPPGEEVLQAGLDILKHTDMREFLRTSSIPAHVLLGEKDTLIPRQCGQSLRQLNPAIKVQLLDGAGHAPFLSQPQQVVAALTQVF